MTSDEPAGRRGRRRATIAREARRTQMYASFRPTELNLVPLVDTFVSIVFFALTAAVAGELMPVARGVTLPTSRVGNSALQQLTLGVSAAGVTLGGREVAAAAEVASQPAGGPAADLPRVYSALRQTADSIRARRGLGTDAPVPVPLAIHGDRAVRYALLARVMQTARRAGFERLTLQVERVEGAAR